jgi:diguanylate cyclase (GGDEF)-like protein
MVTVLSPQRPVFKPSITKIGRLIIVDHEVELLNALCESLTEEGFDVTGFSDPSAALDALQPGMFDVILTDLRMPGMDGIQLLRRVLGIDPNLIVIMMTGQGTIATAVEAMKTGAFDFILKPFRLRQMLPTIERALGVRRLRAENDQLKREVERLEAERVRILEKTNARLAALATTDALTGLANRRAFDEALARDAALVKRGARPLSCVLLDVDDFKVFNDTFGHPSGDEVLRQLGTIIRACCRTSDVAALYGGEEFAILLPGTDLDGARVLAERVRCTVEAGPWAHRPVTVSAGVATLGVDDGAVEWVVGEADRALYRAKRGGRNRVVTETAEDVDLARNQQQAF